MSHSAENFQECKNRLRQQSAINCYSYADKNRDNGEHVDNVQFEFSENPFQEESLFQNNENADYVDYEYLEDDLEEGSTYVQNSQETKGFSEIGSEDAKDQSSLNHNTYTKKIKNVRDICPKKLSRTKKGVCWDYYQTLALIQSYGSHIDELSHPILRKYFWDNVSNDLVSQKFYFDKEQCQSKWYNLLRTYKTCKDKTGREPIRFMFFDAMDEILGTRPSNSSYHTISSLKTKNDLNKDIENDKNFCNENNNNNSKFMNYDGEKVQDDEPSKSRKKSLKKTDEEKIKMREIRNKLLSDLLEVEKTKCELMKKYLTSKANL